MSREIYVRNDMLLLLIVQHFIIGRILFSLSLCTWYEYCNVTQQWSLRIYSMRL